MIDNITLPVAIVLPHKAAMLAAIKVEEDRVAKANAEVRAANIYEAAKTPPGTLQPETEIDAYFTKAKSRLEAMT